MQTTVGHETSSEESDGDEEDSEDEGSSTLHLHSTGWTCDGCGVAPIVGKRFECLQCPGFDLCIACHARRTELHGKDHELVVQVIPAGD